MGTRVLMVAGGTGGHIFPAMAVAEELRARGGFEMEFVGTRRPLEAKVIPAAGFPLHTVDAAGLKGIGGLRRIRNFLVLPRTALAVARILRKFRPRVVVGAGGYLAGPVMLEAWLARIPTLLIEPNARPGFTNRMLRPFVRAAALGFEETAKLYGKKGRYTGHPVRRAFFAIPPHRPAAVDPAASSAGAPPLTLLVVGGSQGARAINQAMLATLPLLLPARAAGAPAVRPREGGSAATSAPVSGDGSGPDAVARRPLTGASVATAAQETLAAPMRIIHQTGERDYNEVLKSYQERSLPVEVHAFIEDMPGALAQADLVISRAGATAVAELAAAGRAAVLIPFPGATDQHQLENARILEKAGAARVIGQSELTPQRLADEIRELLASAGTRQGMELSARALARPEAAARIADLVEYFVRK